MAEAVPLFLYFFKRIFKKALTIILFSIIIKVKLREGNKTQEARKMTFLQKAIMNEIKAHNTEREEDLGMFNKGIKFLSMDAYNKENYENYVVCQNGITLSRYEVKCKFRAPKYENNVVKYQVNIYSNGTMGIYFDGTEYHR